jgi:hypothetical protein
MELTIIYSISTQQDDTDTQVIHIRPIGPSPVNEIMTVQPIALVTAQSEKRIQKNQES